MAGKVFVNYRRDDERAFAARIRDRLTSALGDANVFMDVDNLTPGQRFDVELERALGETDLFIAVIGPRWSELLSARRQQGGRDYVLDEIASALRRGITIIPVTIDATPLPSTASLPDEIRELVLHHKHAVSHEHFGRDVAGLIDAIRLARKPNARARKNSPKRPVPWGWIGFSIAATLLLAYAAAVMLGLPVWAPWPARAPAGLETQREASVQHSIPLPVKVDERSSRQAFEMAEQERRSAEIEARRKASEVERQRLAAQEAEQQQAAQRKAEDERRRAQAETQRKAEVAERQRQAALEAERRQASKAEEEERLRVQAETRHKAEVAERRRQAALEAERQQARKLEEERLKAIAEARQRLVKLKAEVGRQKDLADIRRRVSERRAVAEARRLAEEMELLALHRARAKAEQERLSEFAQVEQQRLAALEQERQRQTAEEKRLASIELQRREQEERARTVEKLQTHLKRLGCYRGTVDGNWGGRSRAALSEALRIKGRRDLETAELATAAEWVAAQPPSVCAIEQDDAERNVEPRGPKQQGKAPATTVERRQRAVQQTINPSVSRPSAEECEARCKGLGKGCVMNCMR